MHALFLVYCLCAYVVTCLVALGHDTKMFSHIVLVTGTINEKALEELELVVECSKRIRVSESSDPEAAVADLGRHTPQFTWVLRDFVLELQDAEGAQINSREYVHLVQETFSHIC